MVMVFHGKIEFCGYIMLYFQKLLFSQLGDRRVHQTLAIPASPGFLSAGIASSSSEGGKQTFPMAFLRHSVATDQNSINLSDPFRIIQIRL